MKIKSLLSLITLGVGVGALGLTSVVSSNASKKSTGEVEAADIGESHGWYLRGSKVGWDAGVPLQYDSDGFYSATVELTQTDINEGKNQFKLFYSPNNENFWGNFIELNFKFLKIDDGDIQTQTEGDKNSLIKTPGKYKFFYISNNFDTTGTSFWLENVTKEAEAEKIYLSTDILREGDNKDGNYLYAFTGGSNNKEPLGKWPGTKIDRLKSTPFLSASNFLNYNGHGDLFEIDVSLLHNATNFILVHSNDGKNAQAQSRDMHRGPGWSHYYSSSMALSPENKIHGSPDLYASASLSFELAQSINATTEINQGASNNYYSVCNLNDKTQLEGLIDKYDALSGDGKTTFDKSTYRTYGSGEGETSTNTDITLAQLMNQINLNYAKTTNSVMFLGGNSSNNATLAVAGISAATIIASASMIILRRHKHKKA